jgi:[acyl-carrier-protein] S-malonyltransferase
VSGRAAFLFPGQGTPLDRVGRERLVRPGPVRELLEMASSGLGLDLVQALAAGDPATTTTEVAQPAIIALTLGLAGEREAAGPRAFAAAGHSLGELTAATFAGCLSAQDAIRAAIARGRLMAEAARAAPGAMAAVRCEDEARVEELLAEGQRHGALDLAARNSPSQWVLSGDRAALGAVAALAPLSFLPATGPWHGRAMRGAAAAWERELRTCEWRRPRHLLVLAGAEEPANEEPDLARALASHLCRPVNWVRAVETLRAAGVTCFVALETGRVLRQLCREILGGACEVVAA